MFPAGWRCEMQDKRKPLEPEWHAEVVAGRLQMKRRDEHGRWIYREPTNEEEWRFLNDEAW